MGDRLFLAQAEASTVAWFSHRAFQIPLMPRPHPGDAHETGSSGQRQESSCAARTEDRCPGTCHSCSRLQGCVCPWTCREDAHPARRTARHQREGEPGAAAQGIPAEAPNHIPASGRDINSIHVVLTQLLLRGSAITQNYWRGSKR